MQISDDLSENHLHTHVDHILSFQVRLRFPLYSCVTICIFSCREYPSVDIASFDRKASDKRYRHQRSIQLNFKRRYITVFVAESAASLCDVVDVVELFDYTKGIESRHNLDLSTETCVIKILLEASNGCVTANNVGIYSKDGSVDQIYADEVVLAAGALQSPQILGNCDIGSREILEHHGIEVLIDNTSVEENFHYHRFSSVSFEMTDGQIS